MFLSPSYQTTIPENTEVGMSILKVSAMDRDENNRLFYTITAAENKISIKKFDIDSRTGMSTPMTGYLSEKYTHCTLKAKIFELSFRNPYLIKKKSCVLSRILWKIK